MAYDCHMETQPPYGLVPILQNSNPSNVTNAGCSSPDPTGRSSTKQHRTSEGASSPAVHIQLGRGPAANVQLPGSAQPHVSPSSL